MPSLVPRDFNHLTLDNILSTSACPTTDGETLKILYPNAKDVIGSHPPYNLSVDGCVGEEGGGVRTGGQLCERTER